MTPAGERNQQWILQAPPVHSNPNEFGEVEAFGEEWTDEGEPFCMVRTLTDIEAERAKAIDRLTTHRVIMLHRDDVRTTWRLARTEGSNTRYLYIVSMRDPDGKRRELELSCAEVVDE